MTYETERIGEIIMVPGALWWLHEGIFCLSKGRQKPRATLER